MKYFRFKVDNSEWSKWYEYGGIEFRMIIKHLNWLAVDKIETKIVE